MFVQCAHVKKYERKCNKITDRPAPILRKSCQIFYTMLLLINVPHGPWSTFKSLSFINLRYDVIFLLLSEICIGFLVGKIPHHQRRNGENSYFLFFLWHSRHNPITSLPSASFPFLSSCSSSSSCAAKSGDFDAKCVRSTCHRV